MSYASIEVTRHDATAVIRMNRPEKGNPLVPEGSEKEMYLALTQIQADRQVRCVVLTGSADVFSIGGSRKPISPDPADMGGFSLGERLAYGYSYGLFWEYLLDFRKPIIAAVNGAAADGAWELALQCDLVVAADSAVFTMNHLDMGLNPYQGTCHYMTQALGRHRATDLVLNAKSMTAAECEQVGLVNRVVPAQACLDIAVRMANEVASRPPLTVALTKRLIVHATGIRESRAVERAVAYFLRTTEEPRLPRVPGQAI